MKKELDNLASCIARRLMAEGFIVQRYNACSTDSIYLKLDYGVCNSIRVSDHAGKKYLKYRYNIGPFVKGFREEKDRYPRFYYRMDMSENMVARIIKDRDLKMSRYGAESYAEFMRGNKTRNAHSPGFWRNAVLLNDTILRQGACNGKAK